MLAVDAGVYRRPMAAGHGHEKHPSLSFFLMPDYINGVVVVVVVVAAVRLQQQETTDGRTDGRARRIF